MKTLQEAYEILKANARYSSGQCEGFVFLSQIEELLEKPKYNQELVDRVRNREIVIEVDGLEGIKDLINFIYPDDPYLEDVLEFQRTFYYTTNNIFSNQPASEYYNKRYWGGNFTGNNIDMETKPRVKASEFLL